MLKPTNKKNIPQMEPWFDEAEAEAVYAYMKSGGWVTEFQKTQEFAKTIADYTGAKFCSIFPNGTITLVAALIACEVKAGDEVIVPDMTMVATPNSASLLGAKVVFADIEEESLCLNLQTIKEKITDKTKAVILVSFNGRYPADLEDIVAFCKEKNICLIEDAAQSLGSYKDGKHLGTFGDIGSFSFSAPKIISTGQGGALVTDNEELHKKLLLIRDFGRDTPGQDHYLSMGWNFKFTDIQAVIGLEQMKKLDWRVKRKKEMYSLYLKELKDCSGVEFIKTNLKETSPWFIDIMVKDGKREELMSYLKEQGVGSRPVYPALHAEPVYKYPESYPITEKIARDLLWLPSSTKLTDEEVGSVTSVIREYFAKK